MAPTAADATASLLACPMCRRPYPSDDVRLDQGLAFCGVCHVVRDLPENAAALLSGAAPAPLPPRQRPPVPLPSAFTVDEIPGALVVKWKESASRPLTLLFALVVFAVGVLSQHGFLVPEILAFLKWSSPAILGLGYVLIASLKNVSSLEARRGQLVLAHGPVPIPWRRRRTVDVGRIDQLYCRRYRANRRTYFELVARLRDGQGEVWVADGFERPEQVLFLEQLLERRLRIEDVAVKGELNSDRPFGSFWG